MVAERTQVRSSSPTTHKVVAFPLRALLRTMQPFVGGYGHNVAAAVAGDAKGAAAFAAYTATPMLWPVGRRLFWHVHDKIKGHWVPDQDAGIELTEEMAETLQQQQQQQQQQQMQQQEPQQQEVTPNKKVNDDQLSIYSKCPSPRPNLEGKFEAGASDGIHDHTNDDQRPTCQFRPTTNGQVEKQSQRPQRQ